MDADGPHRFRNGPFGRDVVQAPGGASGLSHSETRCAAFAGAGASSASTTCRFRESIPHPVQPLSTLRTPRRRDARKTRSRPACSALDGPDFHWQAHSSFPIAPRTRLPPWVSDGELAVCAPAPVTRIFGTVSEACFAGSHSPWPPPLAPPAPQWPKPPCSSASQLLWRSLTSRDRASSATAPRLPDADRRLLPNGRSRDLPVPAQGASAHARVSDHAGSSWRSR